MKRKRKRLKWVNNDPT